MMGAQKKGVQDRSHQRRRKWRSQVLPVATTALHHFFIFLSGVPSLWCSRRVPLSLLSSISSQLSLTSYLAHASLSSIQPVSPGNSTNITLTSVHRQAGRQAGRTHAQSVRATTKKAPGFNSHESLVTGSTPQWEGEGFIPCYGAFTHCIYFIVFKVQVI